jgi:hypothetical protein
LPIRRLIAFCSLLVALGFVAFAATNGSPGAAPAPAHTGVVVQNL